MSRSVVASLGMLTRLTTEIFYPFRIVLSLWVIYPLKFTLILRQRLETVWLIIKKNLLVISYCLQPIAKSSKNCGLQELSTEFWGDQFFGSIFARTYPIFWSSDHGSDEDAATKVFNRKKKPAALPQLFTIELKVIIDSAIKRKFLELNYLQKLAFI